MATHVLSPILLHVQHALLESTQLVEAAQHELHAQHALPVATVMVTQDFLPVGQTTGIVPADGHLVQHVLAPSTPLAEVAQRAQHAPTAHVEKFVTATRHTQTATPVTTARAAQTRPHRIHAQPGTTVHLDHVRKQPVGQTTDIVPVQQELVRHALLASTPLAEVAQRAQPAQHALEASTAVVHRLVQHALLQPLPALQRARGKLLPEP